MKNKVPPLEDFWRADNVQILDLGAGCTDELI